MQTDDDHTVVAESQAAESWSKELRLDMMQFAADITSLSGADAHLHTMGSPSDKMWTTYAASSNLLFAHVSVAPPVAGKNGEL